MMIAWLLLFVVISVIMLVLVARNYHDTLFGSRGYPPAIFARSCDLFTPSFKSSSSRTGTAVSANFPGLGLSLVSRLSGSMI